jgi:hypothetical protein
METNILLAVRHAHSSCETSVRAASRVRPVIPAVTTASIQGTTVPSSSTGFAGLPFEAYGMPQTDDTRKDVPSGYLTWSPPV